MLTIKDTVYIAGPMTGLPQLNYPMFIAVEKRIRRQYGCTVLNPARNFGGDMNRRRPEYIRVDVENLMRSTAVVFLPGWRKSRGATLEYNLADQLDLRLYRLTLKGDIRPLRNQLLIWTCP